MRMTLHLSSISRPQKRDQTDIYNDKYVELFPKFWFFEVEKKKRKFFKSEKSQSPLGFESLPDHIFFLNL